MICRVIGSLLAVGIFVVFFSRKYGSDRGAELSRFPLVVSSCIFLEAVFGLLKINAGFPLWSDEEHLYAYGAYFAFERFFFYVAFWLFALKYHETAMELKIMLGNEITSLIDSTSDVGIDNVKNYAQKRRRKFLIISVVNLIVIAAISVLYFISDVDTSNAMEHDLFFYMAIIFWLIESILIAVVVISGLHVLYKVTMKLNSIVKFNYVPIFIVATL